MSDLFQKIKKESMITSIICIVFGVMFCIWPGTILVTLCRIAGFVLLAAGIVLLIQGIRIREMLGRSVRMFPAVVCVVIGIWILARPGVFVSLIPILIGVMLAYHGLKDLVFCLEVKNASSPRWWIGLLVAIATIIIGVILMLHTWLALEIGMMAVGVILIYDGISGLWLNGRAGRAYKSCHNPEDDIIDVDYKEED